MKTQFRLILLFLVVVVSACAPYLWDNLNTKAPHISAQTIQNESVTIPIPGKKMILHFWAYNHSLSKASLNYFNEIQKKAEKKGVLVYVVCLNWTGSASEIRDFMQRNQYQFPVIFDTDGKFANQYSVSSVPQTQIIQANGNITDRMLGLREDVHYVDEIIQKVN